MKKYVVLFVAIFGVLSISAQKPTASVSEVTFRYCQSTSAALAIRVIPNQDWHGYTFTKSGVYECTIPNARGCDSVVTLSVTLLEGALPGKFSVSATQQVYFAQGNLQYCAAPYIGENTHHAIGVTGDTVVQGVWRFAPNQYTVLRTANTNASATYALWIDCFGWGCSGWKSNVSYYQPWDYYSSTTTASTHINYDLQGAHASADWSYFNAISNGGNQPGLWFTLSYEQWDYIINQRPNAVAMRSSCTVNGVQGNILLPDNWDWSANLPFTPLADSYSVNVYDGESWESMEKAGALFLPDGGRMNGSKFDTTPYYWTSSNNTEAYGSCLQINGSGCALTQDGNKFYGRPVRSATWTE